MAKDDWYFFVSTVLGLVALLGVDWELVKGRIPMPHLNRKSVIFLILILGSLGLSAVGWHKSHHRDTREIDGLKVRNAALEGSNKDLAAKLTAIPPCPQPQVVSPPLRRGSTARQQSPHNSQQTGGHDNQASQYNIGNQKTNGDGSDIINGNQNNTHH
jgi:hypothetical protein